MAEVALPPSTVVDRYVVEAVLGRGGVATVYRVRHRELGTLAALKVLRAPSPSVTHRLLREGRLQGRLRHPNIVAITDVVTVDGAPGLVADLIEGPSLDRFLRDHVPTLAEIDALGRDLLAGMGAAHAAHLIHRDLKPANVLVDPSGSRPTAKVTDFGLAKLLAAAVDGDGLGSSSGAILGTPRYMAPEQVLDSRSVDARADVFAAGAVLFELCVGRRLFTSRSLQDVIDRARREVPSVRDSRADLPDRMVRAIDAAVRPSPLDRPVDANALLALWEDGTSVDGGWTEAGREAARAPAPLVVTPSGGSGSSSTWQEEDVEPPVPAAASRVAAVRSSRAPWLGAGLVALALVAVWWASWTTPVTHLAPGRVPVVTPDPELQASFEAAWEAFLRADTDRAGALLRPVCTALPDRVLPTLLDVAVLGMADDTPRSIEAIRRASPFAERDPDQPGAALVRVLRAGQDRGEMLPGLVAYLDENDGDWLAALFAARWCAEGGRAGCEEAHARLEALDGSPVVADLARAAAWMDLGLAGEASRAANHGLASSPDAAVLHRMLAHAALAEGDAERALAAASHASRLDPGAPASTVSAKAAILSGAPQAHGWVERLRDPALPVGERVGNEIELADLYAGLGRATDALGCLDRARAAEEAEGTPLGTIDAISRRAVALGLRGEPGYRTALMREQVEIAARNPEVPNPVRNRLTAGLVYSEGIEAAMQGDRDAAEAARRRLELADVPIRYLLEPLERELAVLDRDLDAIERLDTSFFSDCARHATVADAFRRAGARDRARARWERVLVAGCPLHTDARANLASARLGLLELAVADGDLAEARVQLEALDALWPSPDPELPAVARRLAAVARLR